MKPRILCVDDDANVLAGYQRSLHGRFPIVTALSGERGIELLRNDGPFAVVVVDMNMPGMNGIEFLREAREVSPDTVRLMLTGNADQGTAMQAVNEGHVFQFLTKPCPSEMLARALEGGLHQHRLLTAERDLLERTLNGSIETLMLVLALAAPHAFGISRQLRDHLHQVTKALPILTRWELEMAAMLAPIGLVTVPSTILDKLRRRIPLTAPERDVVERAPLAGAEMLARIPRLEGVAEIIQYQGKHFDGSGWPADQRRGDRIPLGARILKVLLDLIELLNTGSTLAPALRRLEARAGHYDPEILRATEAALVGTGTGADTNSTPPPPRRAAGAVLAVRPTDLRLGDVLVERLETLEGFVLAGPGMEVSRIVQQKVENFLRFMALREPVRVWREASSDGPSLDAAEPVSAPAMNTSTTAGR